MSSATCAAASANAGSSARDVSRLAGCVVIAATIPNMAGPDDIVARARNLSSGQLCVGKLTI